MNVASIPALLQLLATMAVLVSANISSPNCSRRCGNISIPYPFGISNGCHREGFKLDCNEAAYHPPKLFMDSSRVEVLEISAQHNTLIINSGILSLAGSASVYATWAVPLNSNIYTMSALRNDLVVLGCGFWVLLGWTLQEATATGMKYDCVPGDPTKRACSSKSSNGCYSPVLDSDSNLITVKLTQLSQASPINASLAIMEDGWRKESALTLQKAVSSDTRFGASEGVLHSIPGVPIRTVISWVFNNLSCAEAMNSSDFGCLSNNSYCLDYQGDSTIGGYRCSCRHGYEGNSYERHGCQGMLLRLAV
uniref:Uncharacterized protein n=1 Tax=Avena sativa TaxID=4498 RepID=A0ACD6AE16_AVESA